MCSWWREQQSPKRDSQVLKCYDNVSSICYRNDAIHSLLHTEISMTYCFRFFGGVFGSWRYLLRNLQRTVPWGTSMTERSMRKCGHVLLLPFSLVFPLNLSESILKGEGQVQDFCGRMPTENLAPGFFLRMMNWQPCTCSQREQMEEKPVTILF